MSCALYLATCDRTGPRIDFFVAFFFLFSFLFLSSPLLPAVQLGSYSIGSVSISQSAVVTSPTSTMAPPSVDSTVGRRPGWGLGPCLTPPWPLELSLLLFACPSSVLRPPPEPPPSLSWTAPRCEDAPSERGEYCNVYILFCFGLFSVLVYCVPVCLSSLVCLHGF